MKKNLLPQCSEAQQPQESRAGEPPLAILLVEDNSGDRCLFHEILKRSGGRPCSLSCAARISEALPHLETSPPDLIVLDLALPDSHGLDSLRRMRSAAPNIPIVVLTGMDNEELGMQAMQEGAQDYLVKGQIDSRILPRSLRYALERHRLKAVVEALSVTDELTGLYNRRGFYTFSLRHFELARRNGNSLLLLYADLDGLKQINDTLSHEEGNRALLETAAVLRECFRNTDVLARLGGDEFAVLAIDANARGPALLPSRIAESVHARNAIPGRRFRLSLSVGSILWQPGESFSFDELLARADAAMYAQKQTHRSAGHSVLLDAPAPAARG